MVGHTVWCELSSALRQEINKLEEAKKLIEIEKNERAEICKVKIEEILKQYNCDLLTNIRVEINGQIVTPAIKALWNM